MLTLAVERISFAMDKIVDKVAGVVKETANDERVSFKEEFAKAQKRFMENMPTPEHFMDLIDQLKDITEEEKEKLKKNIADRSLNAQKFKELFTKKKSFESTYQDYYVFVGMVLLIVVVFGESQSSLISSLQVHGSTFMLMWNDCGCCN